MSSFKAWPRIDWGTWALPLYVTILRYPVTAHGWTKFDYIASVRVLCFGFFVEWSR